MQQESIVILILLIYKLEFEKPASNLNSSSPNTFYYYLD